MENNSVRDSLIMRFNCASCGKRLNLSYPKDDFEMDSRYSPGDPTGAKVCYNIQLVEPCIGCVDKLRGPAERLKQALTDIMGDK